MDKKVSVGMVAAIIVIVAITAAILGMKLGSNQNIATTPVSVVQQPIQTAQPQTQPTVVAPQIKTIDYVDPKMNFKVKIPANFFDAKPNDGLNAYKKYFTSKQINGDYNKLGVSDAQLSLVINKNEKETSNAEALREIEAMKKDGLVVSNIKNLTVDGVSATQQIEDSTKLKNTDTDCSITTYFMKNGKSHQIALFSAGGCDTISKFSAEYDAVVNSFQD